MISIRSWVSGLCLVATVACVLPACVHSHFSEIAESLAARDLNCPNPVVGRYQDEEWAFRAEGCGKVAQYRCWYGRKSGGTRQCCKRVPNETAARELIVAASSDSDADCEDHFQ